MFDGDFKDYEILPPCGACFVTGGFKHSLVNSNANE